MLHLVDVFQKAFHLNLLMLHNLVIAISARICGYAENSNFQLRQISDELDIFLLTNVTYLCFLSF